MAAPSKIVDEAEAIRWFEEGRPYQFFVDEYRRKYNIETSLSMWSNWRKRRGLDYRIVRNDDLIPWHISKEHENAYPLTMLRAEACRRAGVEMDEKKAKRLESWLAMLDDANAVVYYDPDTEDGFHYIPREPTDDDLIRRPARKTTLRPRSE